MILHGFLHSKETTPLLWPVGEQLLYKVTWSVFRLGTLKISIVDTMQMNSKRIYHAQLNIDSNPILFFVNHHSEFHTYFDDDLNTHLFRSKENIEGVLYQTEYQFNYTDSILSIDMTDMENTDNRIKKQKRFYGKVLDGTSLLYYARKYAGKTGADTAFYLFAGELNPAHFIFKGEDKALKISGLKKCVKTYYLEGNIPGKGIAGLSGIFQGWFAQQPQKPPIKAKLKVFIGHVNLELESWQECVFKSTL
ncbi:DUF3108 domain-containing protein [bacterium]